MKKFLVVGVGGSGGATLRFMMDQLRAELRPKGIEKLPDAWQFLHIDVPQEPEKTAGLGSIRDLGGHYYSVSYTGNNYYLVGNEVEGALRSKLALRELLGWAPAPKEGCTVDVTLGAGQYRAVGRMLTLTRLKGLLEEFNARWDALQRPDAWGQLPLLHKEGAPYNPVDDVTPIVVGSMAGGSGASMFLDVCRLLSQVPGLNTTRLGVFLYSADVFQDLPAGARTGVDGNALAALGEVLAAQLRLSDGHDNEVFDALGIRPEPMSQPAFARLFPIGASIGGDGAKFAGGTQEGIFRGLGRALAATVSSEKATDGYHKKVENPSPTTTKREYLGWGGTVSWFQWGSFGYASLSLGRDRYAEYASQRMARNAYDRLSRGYFRPDNSLSADEQLNLLVNQQLPGILTRLKLPQSGANVRDWFLREAMPDETLSAEARLATSEAVTAMSNVAPGQAPAWVDVVRVLLPNHQENARQHLSDAAYRWANSWATDLEARLREEYLRGVTQLGLPFANRVLIRLRDHLGQFSDRLRAAPMPAAPLTLDEGLAARAQALRNNVVGAGHALAEEISRGYLFSAKSYLIGEAGRLAGAVLAGFGAEVLDGLERAGSNALQNVERAIDATTTQAGLAQLASNVYAEWPLESDVVPGRFDHAENEVLLTTSAEFSTYFHSDVQRSVPTATTYADALKAMVDEIIIGRWESPGGTQGNFSVLKPLAGWRPEALASHRSATDQQPPSRPSYELAVSTEDVLSRARAHLGRRDQPFEQFSSQSIDHYLTDSTLAQAERDRRADDFVQKFQQTMLLARPLVGVSPPMIKEVHGSPLVYEYSFSELPLGEVAQRLQAQLTENTSRDASTSRAFEKAIVSTEGAKGSKIAIFGSYPKYSPLVYSSLLEQIQKQFDGASEQGRHDLWEWKRTRPLTAGLAMGEAELRTMVRGWFIGQIIGAVATPERGQPGVPAQVWDVRHGSWAAFSRRLLTPAETFRSDNEWLPAILESHVLAIVQSNADVRLEPLRPYMALRALSDESADKPFGAFGGTSGARLLRTWLETGDWPAQGHASTIPDLAGVGTMSQGDRQAAAVAWIDRVAKYIGDEFLTTGGGVGTLARRRPKIDNVTDLVAPLMFAQVAEIVVEVLGELKTQLGPGQQDDVPKF